MTRQKKIPPALITDIDGEDPLVWAERMHSDQFEISFENQDIATTRRQFSALLYALLRDECAYDISKEGDIKKLGEDLPKWKPELKRNIHYSVHEITAWCNGTAVPDPGAWARIEYFLEQKINAGIAEDEVIDLNDEDEEDKLSLCLETLRSLYMEATYPARSESQESFPDKENILRNNCKKKYASEVSREMTNRLSASGMNYPQYINISGFALSRPTLSLKLSGINRILENDTITFDQHIPANPKALETPVHLLFLQNRYDSAIQEWDNAQYFGEQLAVLINYLGSSGDVLAKQLGVSGEWLSRVKNHSFDKVSPSSDVQVAHLAPNKLNALISLVESYEQGLQNGPATKIIPQFFTPKIKQELINSWQKCRSIQQLGMPSCTGTVARNSKKPDFTISHPADLYPMLAAESLHL